MQFHGLLQQYLGGCVPVSATGDGSFQDREEEKDAHKQAGVLQE